MKVLFALALAVCAVGANGQDLFSDDGLGKSAYSLCYDECVKIDDFDDRVRCYDCCTPFAQTWEDSRDGDDTDGDTSLYEAWTQKAKMNPPRLVLPSIFGSSVK